MAGRRFISKHGKVSRNNKSRGKHFWPSPPSWYGKQLRQIYRTQSNQLVREGKYELICRPLKCERYNWW